MAFLRGVERRGAVFAQLQTGDLDTGERALISAMRAFRVAAAQAPIADWPRQFWALLLATPPLRESPPRRRWPDAFAWLAEVGHGPRAALLLRLVAGLNEATAAGVLGVARPTYRLALQRALPRDAAGEPDAAAWRAFGDAAQAAVRDLPAERLAHLARLREAAIEGRRLEPMPSRPLLPPVAEPEEAARRRWTFPAMAAVAAASALAFAATFFVPLPFALDDPNAPRIRVTPLPPAQTPAATFDARDALLTHPDLDQLLDDDPAAEARDPAFYAWLAAGVPASRIPPDASAASPPTDAATPADAAPDTTTETEDAPL
jgi:hypothetical protein